VKNYFKILLLKENKYFMKQVLAKFKNEIKKLTIISETSTCYLVNLTGVEEYILKEDIQILEILKENKQILLG
jgi:hypothetical protein